MEYKDYYKILGVPRDADDRTIKQAYRRLARKHHPDVSKAKGAGGGRGGLSEASPTSSGRSSVTSGCGEKTPSPSSAAGRAGGAQDSGAPAGGAPRPPPPAPPQNPFPPVPPP